MWTIEEKYRSYALTIEVEEILLNTEDHLDSELIEFFLLGLNAQKQWFNSDYACSEDQPNAEGIMFIPSPQDENIKKFCIKLDRAVDCGIHNIDLLMCIDSIDPQPLSQLYSVSIRIQDNMGQEYVTEITLGASPGDLSCTLLSFQIQGNNWMLDTSSKPHAADLAEVMQDDFGAVFSGEYLEASPHAQPSPSIPLVGFSAPAFKEESIDTYHHIPSKPPVASITSPSADNDDSPPSGSSVEAEFVLDFEMDYEPPSHAHESSTNPSAEHHPLQGVDFDEVQIAPLWREFSLRWYCFDQQSPSSLPQKEASVELSNYALRGKKGTYKLEHPQEVELGAITVITGMRTS